MRKSMWLLSAGLFALSTPAFAQTEPTAAPTPSDAAAPPADAATPDTDAVDAAAVDQENADIIVTAQGRSQILQDVPIAVTAVGAEQMQNSGATDIRTLNQLAPSLLVSSTGSEANGSARIRGIGTVGDNPGLESSVAVFIDGVYRSRSGIGLNELGELDRIEVLRGPQGTLFGRNASAGILNIFSKKPSFEFGAYGEATIGNYDYRRLNAGVTGPIGDSGLAFRLDGVWVKRDGFYDDAENDTDVNDRNRYFVRGQLLYQPNSDLTIRVIGDYTHRKEKCCGAVFVNKDISSKIDGLIDPAQNNIIRVLRDLGQDLDAFKNPYSRDISVTHGRNYDGKTTDGGISAEVNYDFGNVELTSITAYRGYKASQGGDLDYGTVDILFRTDDAFRRFKTFSQELRLQGSLFNDRLDWLVGGYFADEKLTVTDDLKFGNQYGRFANCRIISGGGLAGLYSPGSPNCMIPGVGPATILGFFGPVAGAAINQSLTRLDSLNGLGSIQDRYKQNSTNWALFTHNIIHITDQIDATIGVRYTNERKKFDADFENNNIICPANQAALIPFLGINPTLTATAGGIIGLSCQGNSTSELNGVHIHDKRSEHKFTGTGVLSYRPTEDLMLYASYSRGYKAGGFNLDRSALKSPIFPFGGEAGAQALVGNLQFDPETVNAFELGGKYSHRGITVNVALFRQDFENFQLNTFDGTVFIVQNINGCSKNLGSLDQDQSKFSTAPNFTPVSALNPLGAASTGVCDKDDVTWGVRSQGIELEASVRPARDVRINAGVTIARTKYNKDLVGTDKGAPLNPALRELPGKRVSNAPGAVVTGAFAWTPPIGDSGLSGLFYIDGRYSSHYNTGSDLFPQKAQEPYTVLNGRIGIRGPDERWAVELWAQNLLNKDYEQVAFNSPFQEGATGAPFTDPNFPGGRQIFSAFLAEPRTYGLTVRARFSPPPPVVEAAPPPPPPPPAPPPATQTCPDGSVILATDTCPPPPPPPPPPPAPERGK